MATSSHIFYFQVLKLHKMMYVPTLKNTVALDLRRLICKEVFKDRREIKPWNYFTDWIADFFKTMNEDRNSEQHVSIDGYDERFKFDLTKGIRDDLLQQENIEV